MTSGALLRVLLVADKTALLDEHRVAGELTMARESEFAKRVFFGIFVLQADQKVVVVTNLAWCHETDIDVALRNTSTFARCIQRH